MDKVFLWGTRAFFPDKLQCNILTYMPPKELSKICVLRKKVRVGCKLHYLNKNLYSYAVVQIWKGYPECVNSYFWKYI